MKSDPFFIQNNRKHIERIRQNKIAKKAGGKTTIKRVLITALFAFFIMLIIGAVKELMQPGLLRGVIIVLCFLSIFKFWGWIKN